MLDLKGTPDDPSGYAKFRAFMISASDRLDGLGVDAAERMRAAATFVGLPSEWLGESAFAIHAALAAPGLPTDFVAELRTPWTPSVRASGGLVRNRRSDLALLGITPNPWSVETLARVHIMEAVRIEQLVKPYYLQMMRLNALQYADDLAGALRLTGRTVSSGEVVELLGKFWRERVMGAWFSLLCDDDELVLAAVLQALRTSFGSLDAPPLIVAAVVLGGSASAPAIEHYLRRDIEQNWGASGFARAAYDALDGQMTDEPVTTSDRADFEALLDIAQRLRSG